MHPWTKKHPVLFAVLVFAWIVAIIGALWPLLSMLPVIVPLVLLSPLIVGLLKRQ